MGIGKKLSLGRRSLKYKILVAFALMSIIPMLIIAYIAHTYIFPYTGSESMDQVSIIVVMTLVISMLGFVLIRQIINPVIDLALETKVIASGDYKSGISSKGEGELGDIAEAVNEMTGKIRNYIGELQSYSKQTAALNVRIHKKVLSLTNLMRLGDLISTGSGFEEVAGFAAEKLSGELDNAFSAIYIKDKGGVYVTVAITNNTGQEVTATEILPKIPDIERLFSKNEYLFMDSNPSTKPWQQDLEKSLGIKNIILYPMKLQNKLIGMIVIGNFGDKIVWEEEDVGVVRAFEKEMILGYQSFQTYEKVKSLETTDRLTGLYTREHLESRLEDEINRAVYYQRPCSMVVINIDDFQNYASRYGAQKSKHVLRQVSYLLSAVISPVGRAARFGPDEFAMLLPEKNKRETIEVAEDIRKRIEEMEISPDPGDKITVSIGVGENPIDGNNAKSIIDKAYANMRKAKDGGKNNVCGA